MKFFVHIVAVCLLLASSCDNVDLKSEESSQAAEINYERIETADTTTLPSAQSNNVHAKNTAGNQDAREAGNTDWDKKIIKTGRIEVEVDDYYAYYDNLHELVKKFGGYISNEQLMKNEYKVQNDVSIRIPVELFDDAVQQVVMLKGEVRLKEISAQDVTSEYFDTRARMESKKRVRIRYLDMLEKAKNMEEVLQVEREINAIQEQIDAGEGRLKYLGHAAAYSTLNLSFYQVLNSAAGDNDKLFFGDRFVKAFASGADAIGELIIVAVTLWPLWVAAIVVLVVMRSRKLKVKG